MKKKKLDIIYEDKDIIVINKPSGLLTISTEKEKNKTLFKEVSEYVKKSNPKIKIFIIHRLDKDTSGIVIFAKNQNIKYMYQNAWDKIVLKRGYIAVVNGNLRNNEGRIKSYLKETKTLLVYSSNDKKDGKLAITDYKVIKKTNKYSMIDINIKTGRKNQIRVHMKDLGNPILGDKKYGDKKADDFYIQRIQCRNILTDASSFHRTAAYSKFINQLICSQCMFFVCFFPKNVH